MPSDTQDSPPPAPPTGHSPGIRANALQVNFDQALSHTLKVCSYANFAACFSTPAKHVPEALSGLHQEFVGKLERVCKVEFKALLEERKVIPSLNELDGLLIDAKNRMERAHTTEIQCGVGLQLPNPPHLLQPSALLETHLAEFLISQTTTFSSQIEETQRGNADIMDEIATQRTTIESLLLGLENLIGDLEGAAGALRGDEMLGLEVELEQISASAAPI